MKKIGVLAVLMLLCALTLSSCITAAFMLKDSWEYTLCFYTEEGGTPEEIVTENATGNTVDRPWRRYYTFLGYYTAEGAQVFDAEGNQVEDFVIADDMDLYAKFEAITYTVCFDPNGGTLPEDVESPTVSIDSWSLTASVPLPTPPDPSLRFVGWGSGNGALYTDEDGVVDYVSFAPDRNVPTDEEKIVLVAMYTKKTCEVILDYNNGTGLALPLDVEYGTLLDLTSYLEDDTANRYELLGWSTSPYEWVEYEQPVTGYLRLYAVWRAYHDVRFVYREGDVRTTRIYNVNGTGTLPEATRVAHSFDGWYATSSYSGTPVASVPFYSLADTYYAKFTPIDYTITFHTGTDEALAPLVYRYGYTDPLPAPTRVNHVFIGWSDKLDGTGRIMLSLPMGTTGDLELYAIWG